MPIGIIKALFVSVKVHPNACSPVKEPVSYGAGYNVDFHLPNVAVSFLTNLTYYLQLTVYSMFNGHTL